jgi:hypothetical protein
LLGPEIPLKAVIVAIYGNIIDMKINRRKAIQNKQENLHWRKNWNENIYPRTNKQHNE